VEAIMPQLAVAAVAGYAASAATAAAVSAGFVVAGGFGASLVGAAAATVASSLLGKVIGGGPEAGVAPPQVTNTSIRQAAAARRLIYGTVKAGGVLVYPAQSDDGTYAYMAFYLGEGPIQSVDSTFWVGDTLSTDTKYTGLLSLTAYTGAPGQVADAALIAASGGEWTSTEVGNGVAYAIVRYKWDRNAFAGGLEFPAFLVSGRKLYDPRTTLTEYSANPALAMLDYIRSEYGYAAPDSWIDFDSFSDAASICDEVLDSADTDNVVNSVAGKVKRYQVNGVFETNASPAQVVAQIEACCAGRLVFSGGKYRFFAGAYRVPTGETLTPEFLRADPTYRTHPGRQQRINTIRATYREPKQDWQTFDIPQYQLPTAVVNEDGEIVQGIDLPAVTIGAQAQRLALLAMRQSRSAVPLALQCNYAAFQWRLWDTVTVDIPQIGASGVFLITGYSFGSDGGIDLVLVPHLSGDFDWSTANETVPPDVVVPDFNKKPPAVIGLVVTGGQLDSGEFSQPVIFASWTATDFAQIKHYEIQWKKTIEAEWGNSQTVTSSSFEHAVDVGFSYDFRIRIVSQTDEFGPWETSNPTLVAADTTPPGVPTSLSVTHQGVGAHSDIIQWTTPPDIDFSRSRIYVSTVNDSNSALQFAEVFGLPSTQYNYIYSHDDVDDHYYWVQSVDRVGNTSARTYAGGV
jgi:Putative phage tail protein